MARRIDPPGGMMGAAALFDAIDAVGRANPDATVIIECSPSAEGPRSVTGSDLRSAIAAERVELVRSGVDAGDIVAVVADRSVDSVVSFLAILASEAIVLPLDPTYPTDRLLNMIEDSGSAVIRGELPSCRSALNGAFDQNVDRSVSHRNDPLAVRARARGLDPAVVLYTSGSTGRPKGVVLSHQGLAGHMRSFAARLGLDESDRVLQFCSPSCDISLVEVFVPLLTGGSVVLRGTNATPVVDEVLDVVAEHEVTWLDLPTAFWQQLAVAGRPLPPSLRTIVIGGDRITGVDVARWVANRGRSTRLVNGYGPTESSITTMVHDIDLSSPDDPPVGRPLDHIEARLVRPDGTDAEVGETGELVISGPGVAIGYHGRPEETDRAFEQVPTTGVPSTTYRTGDLLRVDDRSQFHFVGRADSQIKVAGHRIELQEIESLARVVPAVGRAVAVARGTDASDRSIALFLEWSESESSPVGPGPDTVDSSIVDGWRAVYDDNANNARVDDPTFNVHGWRNSVDHTPIPAHEMREWVDATIDLIDAVPGDDVLEVGCGTGLLLHRLAPTVDRYVGVDFSAATLATLSATLPKSWDHVDLHRAEAVDLDGVEGRFDLVVMNSVTQHFPSEEYLRNALEAAVDRCRPGGRLIIGDVRARHLLTAFHVDVLTRQRGLDDPTGDVRETADDLVLADEELVIAPAWFREFASSSRVTRVAVVPKVGSADNEMVRFRFDVEIDVEGPPPAPVDEWLAWEGPTSIGDLRERLVEAVSDGRRVGVSGIPNARIVGSGGAVPSPAFRPSELGEAFAGVGLHCEVSWLASGADGDFDIVVSTDGAPSDLQDRPSRWTGELVNRPGRVAARRASAARVCQEVRDHLAAHLPPAVVPTLIEVLDELPCTPSGKIDRARLVARANRRRSGGPSSGRHSLVEGLVEHARDILGRPDFDSDADFFDAGGSSLTAMRLVARVGALHGVAVSPSLLLEGRTMRNLARAIGSAAHGGEPPTVRADRDAPVPLTTTQSRLWMADQLDPEGGRSLIIPAMAMVRTSIDRRVFDKACRETVGRHEALRARVTDIGRDPGQCFDVPVDRIEVSCGSAPDQCTAEREVIDWAFRPFSIDDGPLVRFRCVSIDPNLTLVAVAVHHLIADATAVRIVVDEVLDRALDRSESGESDGTDGTDGDGRANDGGRSQRLQLGDVAVWEHGAIAAQRARLEEHWLEALHHRSPTSLPIAPDRVEPDEGSNADACVMLLPMPDDQVRSVDRAAAIIGTTRFGVLLAAHLVSVAASTGRTSVATAVPVSGRNSLELEPIVGPLIDLVPIVVELEWSATVATTLSDVHRTLVAAIAGQRLGYAEIGRLAPPSWARTPGGVADTMVQVLDVPVAESVHGIEVRPLPDPGRVTRFPLEMIFEQRDRAVGLRLTWSPSVLLRSEVMSHGASVIAVAGRIGNKLDHSLADLGSLGEQRGSMSMTSTQHLPDPLARL